MSQLIDYDDTTTFPKCLNEFDSAFERMILQSVDPKKGMIEEQIRDICLSKMPIVQEFLKSNMETEIAVCHCARILDEKSYWENGISIEGGQGSAGDKRIRELLHFCGFQNEEIKNVLYHIYKLWDRDGAQRTESVHFFADKSQVYKDDQINCFALNLGGEVVRWAIESMGKDLYKQEPYKRLWILGTPSIVKLKCKLSNISELRRDVLIGEIVKYNIAANLFQIPYEISVTGMTTGSVPPEDIISIEEIAGFNQMQEKYAEYNGFYD